MYRLSIRSIWYVIIRNYMSFRRLFKISVFPNLLDPLLFLVAMGLGLGHYLQDLEGVPYATFVASGLIAATGMMASTAEVTVNAFIQMRVERTYAAVTLTPVNLQDVVVGQILWSACRSVLYGLMFLGVAAFFGVVHSWTVVFIPVALFLTGIVFGELGMLFTAFAPNQDYLNYYNVLVIRPLYMFSGIFFPLGQMPDSVKVIAWFSPLYHASELCRGLLLGRLTGLGTHSAWLLVLSVVVFMAPIAATKRKLAL